MSDADDREAVDRAFAELVAGYHLTADRPDPPALDPTALDPTGLDPTGLDPSALDPSALDPSRPDPSRRDPFAGDRPVFDTTPEPGSRFEPPEPDQEPTLLDLPFPAPDESVDVPEERFEPEPPPPLPRPAWPVVAGWIGLGYAVLTILAIAVGIGLPAWAAWAGVVGFVGGFGLLVSRLPRQRPPDAGDGAVL